MNLQRFTKFECKPMNILTLTLTTGVTYLLLLGFSLFDSARLLPMLPWLLLIFSFPHFLMTYWLWLKRMGPLREEIWPLLFPFIYVGVFLFGPFPTYLIVKFSYAYLIYHFAQQLYGVTVWSVKGKLKLENWEKHLLRAYFLLNGFYALLDLERRGVGRVLFYYETPSLDIPSPLIYATFFMSLCLLSLILGRIGYRFLKSSERSLLALVSSLGLSLVWFIPPFSYEMVFFLPIIHALQFFPLAKLKLSRVSKSEWMLGGMGCFLFGWLFFRFIPFVEVGWVPYGVWPVLILTLLNNHHFVIEGRIWKLRDPKNADL
jgi:hypothetical protein